MEVNVLKAKKLIETCRFLGSIEYCDLRINIKRQFFQYNYSIHQLQLIYVSYLNKENIVAA